MSCPFFYVIETCITCVSNKYFLTYFIHAHHYQGQINECFKLKGVSWHSSWVERTLGLGSFVLHSRAAVNKLCSFGKCIQLLSILFCLIC